MTDIERMVIGKRLKEFPGNSWNQMADLVEGPPLLQPKPVDFGGAGLALGVFNESDTDIPVGGIMRPTGSMLSTADADFAALNGGTLLNVDVPDSASESIYMVSLSYIPAKRNGSAVMMGSIWARVDIRDTTDKYAQAIDGDATKLESTASASRARIIAQESGTGEKWAMILLAPYRMRIRKGIVNNSGGQTDIPVGGSGTVNVYVGGANTGEENTWWLDWLNPGTAITTDREVIAADFEDDNIFTVIAAECEPKAAPAPPGHGDNITASTTQTRGEGQLSYRVNRITTCANTNDTVTLPGDFEQGDDCFVQNAGAQTLQIFPEDAGDTIDGGTPGASVTLAAGGSAHFFLVQSDEWVT